MTTDAGGTWRTVRLSEAVEPDAPIIYGILQPGPEQATGVPYVRPTEIVGDRIDVSAVRKTTAEIAEKYRRASLRTNDIILSIVGTIGKVAIVPPELEGANITQSSARVRARAGIVEPRYLAAVLRSPLARRQYEALTLGTGVPRLNLADVREIEIPLPNLSEQRRIVAHLDACFARSRRAKAALDDVPALVGRLRQSILAAAFRGDLTADWREENPGVEPASELLKRIRAERRRRWEEAELAKMVAKGKAPKDDRWKAKYEEPVPVDGDGLPELPDGWCWASLDDLTTGDGPIVYGIIQPGPEVPEGVPFVRPTEIVNDTIDVAALHRCSQEVAAAYERARLIEGDLILTIVGTIGKVATVPAELVGANITQSSARVRPTALLPTNYLAAALRSPAVRSQFKRYEFGNAVRRLNISHVRQLGIPLAPLLETRPMVARLTTLLARVAALSAQAAELTVRSEALFPAVLRRAMGGAEGG